MKRRSAQVEKGRQLPEQQLQRKEKRAVSPELKLVSFPPREAELPANSGVPKQNTEGTAPPVVPEALVSDVAPPSALIARRQGVMHQLAELSDEAFAIIYPKLKELLEPQAGYAAQVEKANAQLSAKSEVYATEAFARKPLPVERDELPQLPPGLRWPSEPKELFSYKAKYYGLGIVQFLEETWLPLIEAGVDELRWLRKIDKSAVVGITSYERMDKNTGERKLLPSHLRFMPRTEATDRRVLAEGGVDNLMYNAPKRAVAIATRLIRASASP